MWGKVGINCFLLITGYFMCVSKITLRKFLKLLLQVYFFKLLIFVIFLIFGLETLTITKAVKLLLPGWGLKSNFTMCFLVFYLTIPFWNILIGNMTKKQHLSLMSLLLFIYTILGTIPGFSISFNYVTWFGVIYLIASYIRLYPINIFNKKQLWLFVTIVSIVISVVSVIVMAFLLKGDAPFYFVADCNKILAVIVAVSSFLYFKNLNIKHSKLINTIGGATFGVFLIHANSSTMRNWLWKDLVDVVGNYNLPLLQLILYSICAVIGVFCTCACIDILRKRFIEIPIMNWFDDTKYLKNEKQ